MAGQSDQLEALISGIIPAAGCAQPVKAVALVVVEIKAVQRRSPSMDKPEIEISMRSMSI